MTWVHLQPRDFNILFHFSHMILFYSSLNFCQKKSTFVGFRALTFLPMILHGFSVGFRNLVPATASSSLQHFHRPRINQITEFVVWQGALSCKSGYCTANFFVKENASHVPEANSCKLQPLLWSVNGGVNRLQYLKTSQKPLYTATCMLILTPSSRV